MKVLNKYQILEQVGRGGMGIVYKAQDEELGRIVAIKELLINEGLSENEKIQIIQRFQREAKTASALKHENLVSVFDFGESDSKHYIVMEFLKGKNLKEYLEQKYRFKLETLLSIFIQVAKGLAYAHSKNIIHRDIKPANIQLMERNLVKITDFGLAKSQNSQSSLTTDGTMFGSLGYISPEQLIDSKNVNFKADMFSFGASMYELITEKLVFEGDNIGATIYNILNMQPKSILEQITNFPQKLEEIIFKCMEKDPEKRYENMNEVIKNLEECLNKDTLNKIIIEKQAENYDKEHLEENKSLTKTSPNIILKTQILGNENLKKGQKVFIKEKLHSLNFYMGINWSFDKEILDNMDCYVFLLNKDEKIDLEENFVFYNNISSPCKSIKLDLSDNIYYKSVIEVNLEKVPENIQKIRVVVSLNDPKYLKDLKSVNINFIHNIEKIIYNIDNEYFENTIILVDIYNYNGEWKVQACGDGYKSSIVKLLQSYSNNITIIEK